jgi:hypothetical protein
MCVCVHARVCVYVDLETRKQGGGVPLFITLLDLSTRDLFSLEGLGERKLPLKSHGMPGFDQTLHRL